MRASTKRGTSIAQAAVIVAGLYLVAAPAALAQSASAPAAGAEERRLLDEIDMLERARAEAEARREELARQREAAEAADRDRPAAGAQAAERKAAAERRLAEETRKAEEAHRLAEDKRKAEEARRLAAEEKRKAEEARRLAEDKLKAEEARRFAEDKLKAEEARRLAEESRKAAEDRRLAEEESRKAAEARRLAEETRAAEAARRLAADEKRAAGLEAQRQSALEAEREAEAESLDAALRRAREARDAERQSARTMPVSRDDMERDGRRDWPDRSGATGARSPFDRAVDTPVLEAGPETAREAGHWSPSGAGFRPAVERHEAVSADADRPSARSLHDGSLHDGSLNDDSHLRATTVTVLLHMTPGTYGIRRRNQTADPLLCGERGCYVSEGAAVPAELLRRRRALGVRGTLGRRAGACRNSLGCVFRGVDLVAYPAIVQPVDMHVLRHDKRQPMALHETSDCRIAAGHLACARPYRGPDYVMWVVPEAVAAEVGAEGLEAALASGLDEPATAGGSPNRN